jgi:ATP dependent DNA ligase C terminal region
MKQMPGWAWPLLGGVAVVAGASVAVDYLLPEECLARALCSALLMMLSVIGLIVAQLWAVLFVGASEEGLGAKDVILPGKVWRAAFRHLPATRKPVWMGMWYLTALICGVAVIGGFNYWLEAVKAKRLRQVAEALAQGINPDAPPEEPASKLKASADSASPGPTPAEDKRRTTQCVVIGYQTDGETVTGLVLATTDGDRLLFVGVVREGLSPALRQDLMKKLKDLVREDPLIPGVKVKGAKWVKPGVFCDVVRSGGKPGEGEEPAFKG